MANDLLSSPFYGEQEAQARVMPGAGVEEPVAEAPPLYNDADLLALWNDEIKPQCFNNRFMFERQWQRNIWYVLGRQWIEWLSGQGGWRDKRIAQWIPRPVTNKCKETLQAIRAMFTSIQLGVNVRPNGGKPENVSAAATADALAPVFYELHHMNAVLNEFDFWLIVTGNAFLHTFVDYDIKHGTIVIRQEQCQQCGAIYGSDAIAEAEQKCPDCGATEFQPAVDPLMGTPVEPVTKVIGRPTTIALSPLELAFRNSYPRFSELPEVVRCRWRTKGWMLGHDVLGKEKWVQDIKWQKSPTDQSLQIFTNLSKYSDLGISPTYSTATAGGSYEEDGIPEYEVWMRPCLQYPEGLVFRVYGDSDPHIAHLEETEAIPGPLPYKTADGTPLFPFAHAAYEHVGGRVLGSGPIDVIIQKQDQLNQLDSLQLLIIQRMANPVWLEPKGAEIQKLTGMPGLVIKWNPLTVGGQAKPERIPGVPLDQGLNVYREILLKDIEELAGTFDVIKGAKPAGVEAFSALQLLVERSQARFASVFQARGDAFKNWFTFAVELEREFGPDEYTKHVLQPGRGWTFESFKRSQLVGSYSIIVEDGTAAPKTNLGKRAAVDHAVGLGILDIQNPDTKYEILSLFGLNSVVPSLDIQITGALQKQDAFEKWILQPQNAQMALQGLMQYQQGLIQVQAQVAAQSQTMAATGQPVMDQIQPPQSPLIGTPLEYLPWFNATIHYQEFMKWANSDRVRDLLKQPQIGQVAKALLTLHCQELEEKRAAELMPAGPPMQGAGMAMANSNANSGQGQGTDYPARVTPPGRTK